MENDFVLIGYDFEVYYEGSVIREFSIYNDTINILETAEYDAENYIENKIEDWSDSEYPPTREDFDYEILEVWGIPTSDGYKGIHTR
jgi:hypothetical protein